MNGSAQTIGLDQKRIRWPSAATCAFVASGLEIVSFAAILMQDRAIASARSAGVFPSFVNQFSWAITVSGLLLIAAQAKAFWGIARVQQADAPVSTRLGKRAFIAFLVSSLLVLAGVPVALMAGNTASIWMKIYTVPASVAALADGLFGWASRGSTYPWQRWASFGLLVMAGHGLFNVIQIWFGLPNWEHWPGFLLVLMSLHAGTWAAVGAWLRRVPVDGASA